MLPLLLIGCTAPRTSDHVRPHETSPPATVTSTGPPESTWDTGTHALPNDTAAPLEWVTAQVGGGLTSSCGLDSGGNVHCWGHPDCADQEPGPNESFLQVSVGVHNGCGVHEDGTVRCWCCDSDYPSICTDTPAGSFAKVVSGGFVTCGQDAAGMLTCWGALDYFSAVGAVPVAPVLDFAVEQNYAAAVLGDHTLAVWGMAIPWSVYKPPAGVEFAKISLGRRHACALDTAGTAYCWGTDTSLQPFPNPPPGPWAQIETYNEVTCLIDAAGSATCLWGLDIDALNVWTQQMPPVQWAQIGLGEWDGCGVDLDGQAWCWAGDPAQEPWLDVPHLAP